MTNASDADIPPRLRMRNIHKSFGATHALRGVSFDVRPREVHALVGENGAGKSTLMKILSGVHQPDDGEMLLEGRAYVPRSPVDGRSAGIGMIYQELSLAPHLSVMENILLGVEPCAGPFVRRREMRDRSRQALRAIGRDDIRPEARAGDLSIAEQQLVEITRSVAVGCRVLVFDEPTSCLTQADVERLFDLIRRLRADGLAIVYISHVLEEVRAISDRVTVLRDGSVAGSGSTGDLAVHEIVSMMVGRDVEDLYPRSKRTPGDVILSVDHLGGKRLPKSASLELRRGEVLGIAGLIGSGRTELIRAIFGLDAVATGELTVAHVRGAALPDQRWRQGVGYVSEDRKEEGLAIGLSVSENVTLPKLGGLGPWIFVTPREQDRATRRWIDRLSIRCASTRQPIDSLSGGNQQKVAIARLLHADVDVLLLDEPTRGIDVGSKAQIYQLIDDLACGRGGEAPEARASGATSARPRAVLMVSSYLPELLGVCDRIAVMHRGRLGRVRPVEAWSEHAIMLQATGTEAGLT